jgi:hypothetical protein
MSYFVNPASFVKGRSSLLKDLSSLLKDFSLGAKEDEALSVLGLSPLGA